jgi:hypothetical protein
MILVGFLNGGFLRRHDINAADVGLQAQHAPT